jgi:MoaA/NifB/PqqE/SkfB family radical SAM enzyme
MATVREEHWGHIVYDPEQDEFEARAGSSGIPRTDRPLSVGCLVTPACNLRCAYCYGNLEALPPGHLSATNWAAAFRTLAAWGTMRVDLSGGEPTMRKDIGEIAELALREGLNVVVSTNGMVLTRPGELFLRSVRLHVSMDSGRPGIHQASRILPNGSASAGSFDKVTRFLTNGVSDGFRVRVMTCVGPHNEDELFALGEHLALLRVPEWNVSRILHAGRAKENYDARWRVSDDALVGQIHDMRAAYPFMRIRYSSRMESGYFLLVLNNGSVATQYTDERDKVIMGNVRTMTLKELQSNPLFDFDLHGRKWIAATRLACEPAA